MADWTLITRADDLGSSRSANQAIERVVNEGFIKNVSIMACGPFVEEAAQRLAGRKDICFGMHTTLNAEWDKVKWEPVSAMKPDCGLLDEQGYFLNNPEHFLKTKPSVELIMKEVSAQLDRLQKLGFDIRYIDSHMFSELFVDGMDEAMEEFICKKGLVDHMYFYQFVPGGCDMREDRDSLFAHLKTVPSGQYLTITHPSLDTEEMRMTGNGGDSGLIIARERAAETAALSTPGIEDIFRSVGCMAIRYDEAVVGKRMTVEDLRKALAG